MTEPAERYSPEIAIMAFGSPRARFIGLKPTGTRFSVGGIPCEYRSAGSVIVTPARFLIE
jgi:hypothetical protein